MAVGPGGHEALLKLACLQLNPKDERNTGVNRILDGWWLRMGHGNKRQGGGRCQRERTQHGGGSRGRA